MVDSSLYWTVYPPLVFIKRFGLLLLSFDKRQEARTTIEIYLYYSFHPSKICRVKVVHVAENNIILYKYIRQS